MPTALALLVGLTSVDPSRYGGWDGRNGCTGCELDVDNISALLKPLGYEQKVLKTAQATSSAILKGLKDAAKRLKRGDIFVFILATHGGQRIDLGGDEDDGKDETIVAYDREIVDDELGEIWLTFAEGVRIVMVSDTCNAETNFRAIPNSSLYKPWKPMCDTRTAVQMKAQMIHFGGCRDGATSEGNAGGGVFTEAVCQVLKPGFKGNYSAFYRAVLAVFEAGNQGGKKAQEPQKSEYGPVTDDFRNQVPFDVSGERLYPGDGGCIPLPGGFGKGNMWRGAPDGDREVSIGLNIVIRAVDQDALRGVIENQLGTWVISEIARNPDSREPRPCSGSASASAGSGGWSVGGSISCSF